jgi:hypothetical protein
MTKGFIVSPMAGIDSRTEHQPVEPLASDKGSCTSIEHNKLVLAMARLITNFIHIPPVLRVHIKVLYDVVNVSKPALDLAWDHGYNTF